MAFRNLFQWLSRRSALLITALAFAVAILLVWFLVAGFTPGAQAVNIGIAAIATLLAAISSIASLLQAVETQKQRENLERPYVLADFDSESSGVVTFVIQNLGNSPAKNVSIEIEPPPVDFRGRQLNEISLLAKPIGFLPPGRTLRQVIDASFRFLEAGKPRKFKITTKYASAFGETFKEVVDHDLEYLVDSTLPKKSADDYLKNISEEIKSIRLLLSRVMSGNALTIETQESSENEEVVPNTIRS